MFDAVRSCDDSLRCATLAVSRGIQASSQLSRMRPRRNTDARYARTKSVCALPCANPISWKAPRTRVYGEWCARLAQALKGGNSPLSFAGNCLRERQRGILFPVAVAIKTEFENS